MYRLLCFICIGLLFACNRPAPSPESLGEVEFKISGKENAAEYFHKGLLLLHSFEYDDAREAFLMAQEIDSKMAMAYWGEAMSYNHSLWSEQDYEKGVAALEKLKRVREPKMDSELEKAFIQAIHILYDQEEEDKVKRDQAYADYLAKLHDKFPKNHEVAAFYALSLLGAVPEGRDTSVFGQGARIAQSILAENPNHPGALHYLIHSYDDPDHAKLAIDAAFSYSEVAPDASHALHMPSHIFVALGMWDEVIRSNVDSYKASVQRMETKELDNDARGYHAYHWLEYAYLQKNMIDSARLMVHNMEKYVEETPSKRARVHLVFLKGTFLNETGLWDDPISNIEVETEDLNISVRAKAITLNGMKAYYNRDTIMLRQSIDSLRSAYELESFNLQNGGTKMCAGASRRDATQTDINEAKVMESQMLALEAWLEEDMSNAEKHLIAACDLDDSMSYSYGPPHIQYPTHELYAHWLEEQGRLEEAMQQYDYALARGTKRLKVLKAQLALAQKLKDEEQSKKYEYTIQSILNEQPRNEKSL